MGTGRVAGGKQAKLDNLWTLIREYYDEAKPPSRIGSLTSWMLKKSGKAPRLRAKGAETRHLVPFAVGLAEDYQEDIHGQTRFQCALALFQFYDSLNQEPYSPSSTAAAGRRHLQLYEALSVEAAALEIKAWPLKPKHHQFSHLAEEQSATLGNPRKFWEYCDEDFVGFAADTASTHKHPNTLESNVMMRLRAMVGDHSK